VDTVRSEAVGEALLSARGSGQSSFSGWVSVRTRDATKR